MVDASLGPTRAPANVYGGGVGVSGVGVAEAPATAALDLHEGISAPSPLKGCPRWPEDLRLQASDGRLVMGRCKAANQCDYCAKLAAVETAEVLALDALNNSAPAVWAVLTTRTATLDMRAFYNARQGVTRAIRRRWPDAESATLVEFTTGMGRNAGGSRRPHWNDLLKGVPTEDLEELHAVIARAWCSRVDALPRGQYVGSINETGGLMRYLALHFQKEDQAPPKGWNGHRFRTTRGYLGGRSMEAAREEARAVLRYRRELWKAERDGLTGQEALDRADAVMCALGDVTWTVVRRLEMPTAYGPDGLPSAFAPEWFPVRA